MAVIQHIPNPFSGEIQAALPGLLDRTSDLMHAHLRSGESVVDALVEHVQRYRGKMLRPSLTFVAGAAAHEDASQGSFESLIHDDHVTIAAVLETIHLATLVHDDVLDEAAVRRNAQTVNRLSGNEAAVILGDYLFARSYHLCSTLQDQTVALRVGEVTSHVCRGEMTQLSGRGDASFDEATYFRMIEGKTASLIAAACELGAHASGASADVTAALHRFGMKLGCAFQVQDDLLDLTGDEHTVGKPVGRDLEMGKPTLPLIHHLARADEAQSERVRGLIETRRRLNGSRNTVIAQLHETGSIAYARRQALALADAAIEELSVLADSPARRTLATMAQIAVSRDH